MSKVKEEEDVMRQVLDDSQGSVTIGAAPQEELLTLVTNLEQTSAAFGLDINYSMTKVTQQSS